MASEIRVNQIQSRTGVSTISFTETGPIISGVTTITGDLDVTGLVSYDDVTNIDSVGVVTARNGLHVTTGSVGIGTDNPSNLLHVHGQSRFEDYLRGNSTHNKLYIADDVAITATKKLYFDGGSNTYIDEVSADTLRFSTAGTERLRVDSSGRLLIGRTSALASSAERLTIDDGMAMFRRNSASAAAVYIRNEDTTADTRQPYLIFTDGGGNRGGFGVQYNESSLWISGQGGIAFRTGGSAPSQEERLRIDSIGQLTTKGSNQGNPVGIEIRNNNTAAYSHAQLALTSQNATTSKIWCDVPNSGMRLNYNGGTSVKIDQSGNLVMANGAGIDFSATTNSYGSMGSELLDDYEEGTWTPVINKSGVGGFVSNPSTAVGYYRKVGKILWISFYWYKGSGGFGNNAGEWYVSGLPYLLAHGTGGAYQFISGGYNNINGTNYQNQSNRWQSNNTNGSATLAMYGPNSTTNWTSGYAEFSATGCVMVP